MERQFFSGFMGRDPFFERDFPPHHEPGFNHMGGAQERFAGSFHNNMMEEIRRDFDGLGPRVRQQVDQNPFAQPPADPFIN